MSKRTIGITLLALGFLALGLLFGSPNTNTAAGGKQMTSQSQGNPYSRGVEISRNIETITALGLRADRVTRNNQGIGVVKAGTRRITATSFIADVEIATRFNGKTVTVKDVRFNVPVQEGDAVSLEIIGGNPLNGMFGTPVRPHGPQILSHTTNDYTGANAPFDSYLVPFDTEGDSKITTPLTSSIPVTAVDLAGSLVIHSFPDTMTIDLIATLKGGLRIVGGEKAGNYAIRWPAGNITLTSNVESPDSSILIHSIRTHYGLEPSGIKAAGETIGNYVNMAGEHNPLSANGQRIIFSDISPEQAGGIATFSILLPVAAITDLQYYRTITHPEYSHPAYSHPQYQHSGSPPEDFLHPAGNHPAHEHPEYSFSIWDDLPAPEAGEQYFVWLGLSDVQVNIVELGTGGR